MNKLMLVNKQIGETPLDVIRKLKTADPNLSTLKMTYSGRLDPMAEGLMVILVGEECKKRKEYEMLPKTYEFGVLFNVATDTYDVLGKITNIGNKIPHDNIKERLKKLIPQFTGKQTQPYPPYSSPKVNGKALFEWAKLGKIDTIKIPEKKIEIYSLKLNSVRVIQKEELENSIFDKLNKIKGEFRQEEIKNIWRDFFNNTKQQEFLIAKLTINCSSGTYVRSISNEIGKRLDNQALAYSIKRLKVGPYSL